MIKQLKRGLAHVQQGVRETLAERAVEAFRAPTAEPHSLPGKLIVTLTSYPARYDNLAKTLKSLLMQTVRADITILWIAKGDLSILPREVFQLQSAGLEIRTCDDLRSYKKIIPALEAYPDAYLVTADDDLYYGKTWLKMLVEGATTEHPLIVCRRAHRPCLAGDRLAPYAEWQHDIKTGGLIERSIFPTGCGGVLYPPKSLAPETTDRARFLALSPHADDVWLFVMALRAGTPFRQVGGGFAQVSWTRSQASSLMQHNLQAGGNDRQLAAVLSHYGLTDALPTLLKNDKRGS